MHNFVKGIMANRSGVSVLGVPMGSDDYINTFFADKVEHFFADFPALNKVYLNFVRLCLAPRLHYLLGAVYSSLSIPACAVYPALSIPACATLDTTIQRNLLEVMGWESFDPTALDGWMDRRDR